MDIILPIPMRITILAMSSGPGNFFGSANISPHTPSSSFLILLIALPTIDTATIAIARAIRKPIEAYKFFRAIAAIGDAIMSESKNFRTSI